MTAPVMSSMAFFPRMIGNESKVRGRRAYRTKTSFVAVLFDQAGKGRIVFLPKGAMLRVIGPSYCVPGGFEVMFEHRRYNIFEIDMRARSTLIYEPIRAKRHAVAVCA